VIAILLIYAQSWKEENSKISEHVHRTGYHFRESIVDEAREIIGETVISNPTTTPGFIEPIPESQDEINKQADGAIRDLFPRIPNTDRQMIIEHAFKKVGKLQTPPASAKHRRVLCSTVSRLSDCNLKFPYLVVFNLLFLLILDTLTQDTTNFSGKPRG
jgi:Uncharacterized conserved protein (DUF2293)